MKKFLAALLMLLLFAGIAFADDDKTRDYDEKSCKEISYREYCSNLKSDFKEDYKALHKLTSELREEMKEDTPDKKKAKKLYKEITELRRELCKKGFERRMEYYEECREKGYHPREHRKYGYHGKYVDFRGYHCPGTIVIDTVSKAERENLAKLYKELGKEKSKTSPDWEKIKALHKEITEKHEKFREKAFEELLEHPERYKGAVW